MARKPRLLSALSTPDGLICHGFAGKRESKAVKALGGKSPGGMNPAYLHVVFPSNDQLPTGSAGNSYKAVSSFCMGGKCLLVKDLANADGRENEDVGWGEGTMVLVREIKGGG